MGIWETEDSEQRNWESSCTLQKQILKADRVLTHKNPFSLYCHSIIAKSRRRVNRQVTSVKPALKLKEPMPTISGQETICKMQAFPHLLWMSSRNNCPLSPLVDKNKYRSDPIPCQYLLIEKSHSALCFHWLENGCSETYG